MTIQRYTWGTSGGGGGGGSADKVTYDPTTSKLPATDVQTAIDVEAAEIQTETVGAITQTTAALTYYVSTTGSDSNSGLTPSAALATIQAAIDKVPKFIEKYNATISIGAGNFAGFRLSGFIVPRGSIFTIAGTLGLPILISGTTSGVATSGSTLQCVQTGQTWTVNDLRGRLINVGSEYRVIRTNTADTINFIGPLSTSCSGKAYTLYEQKTIINSDSSIATVRASFSANRCTRESIVIQNLATTGGTYGFYNRSGDGFTYSQLKASTASNVGIGMQSAGGETIINDCYSTGNTTYGFVSIDLAGQLRAQRCYAYANGRWGFFWSGPGAFPNGYGTDLYADGQTDISGAGIFMAGNEGAYPNRWYASSNAGMGIVFWDNVDLQISTFDIEGSGGDGLVLNGSTGTLADCTTSGNTGYGISCNYDEAAVTNGLTGFGGKVKMSGSCVISSNAAGGIRASSTAKLRLDGVIGTSNGTYGLLLESGATAEITATTSITGATGNATIDAGATTLTWATDFATDGDSITNAATGSGIERKD